MIKTKDVDLTKLAQVFQKHDAAIQSFYQAVRQEYEAGDVEAVEALLATVSGMLISLSQQHERFAWFYERIEGRA
jgi:hypothetical protein